MEIRQLEACQQGSISAFIRIWMEDKVFTLLAKKARSVSPIPQEYLEIPSSVCNGRQKLLTALSLEFISKRQRSSKYISAIMMILQHRRQRKRCCTPSSLQACWITLCQVPVSPGSGFQINPWEALNKLQGTTGWSSGEDTAPLA